MCKISLWGVFDATNYHFWLNSKIAFLKSAQNEAEIGPFFQQCTVNHISIGSLDRESVKWTLFSSVTNFAAFFLLFQNILYDISFSQILQKRRETILTSFFLFSIRGKNWKLALFTRLSFIERKPCASPKIWKTYWKKTQNPNFFWNWSRIGAYSSLESSMKRILRRFDLNQSKSKQMKINNVFDPFTSKT